MKNNKVNVYLVTTVLVLSIVPFVASVLLLDEILDSTINFSLQQNAEDYLRHYQHDLKKLRNIFPEEEAVYKSRFFGIEKTLRIIENPDAVASLLRHTYMTYYLALFIAVILVSLAGAVILSRKVSRSYAFLMESEALKSKRIRELSYFEEWKIIAGKLAHEIKTPLTPIAMMVSNLAKSYEKQKKEDFERNLRDTIEVVEEEIQKLRGMVNHFSSFSKLPEPVLKKTNVVDYLATYTEQYKSAWPTVNLHFKNIAGYEKINTNMDCLLFNQCFGNLIINAVEANPEKKIELSIILKRVQDGLLVIEVFNEGIPIKEQHISKIFNMYYSTKTNGDNMGIGLPIVKKIVLDHGGVIDVCAEKTGVLFTIKLPVLTQ